MLDNDTSTAAIAERPRDACSTSNRKPVKIAFVRRKSVDVSDFWRGLGHFDRPFLVEGDVAHQPLLGGRKLEWLPFHIMV